MRGREWQAQTGGALANAGHEVGSASSCAGSAHGLSATSCPLPAIFVERSVERGAKTRRHHHGQPVRLADDAARRGNARGARHRLRGPHRLGPSHARPARRLRQGRARRAGFKVIIAGAGGAAHLPGMTAAFTTLPVFGVPVERRRCRARTACSRSCRCRRACRSARSRSATPARSMRRSGRRRAGALRRRARRAAGSLARRAQPTAVAERPADEAGSMILAPGATIGILGARPARPHAGDGGAEARPALPYLCARGRRAGA